MMFTEIGRNIEKAARLLQNGEVVAIPTETVYGLAGNALSEAAVTKIYAAKKRPSFNPLILHIANIDQIICYATPNAISLKLANAFMPGPLTLLLPKKNNVPDITTAGSNKVAIRVPNHPLALELLYQINFPLAAPSANQSGYISPTTAQHVYEGLNHKISYILDGGTSIVGLESTICEVMNDHILLHRTGGISANMLQDATGLPVIDGASHERLQTPGQLKSHYAPNTPLYRGNIETLIDQHRGKKMAVISFYKKFAHSDNIDYYILSETANLSEAANKLFSTLREIDAQENYEVIITEIFPEEGIGPAINDRLNRAQFIHK